ncbi:hypothetical protein Bca4012_033781 [Brassica carinata]|uniref:Uncharacterized protein n=1 Tax=Brassica oleracea TaxID=3712 RepID=A0A3P6CVP8_BRAOL|nr:unnamed protein product [Brassica oleracea]
MRSAAIFFLVKPYFADLLFLLLMYWFVLYTLNLCSSSPLRSVHQWLQTNLKQLILHVKQVARNVYVVKQKFKLVNNFDLRFEVVRVHNILF